MKATLLAAFALILLAMLTMTALPGCQYVGNPVPRVESEPYTGPAVAINSFAAQHQITITAPTGGWDSGVDEVRNSAGRRQVFITAVRPARDEMVTQALQAHELNSTVDSRTPIDIYIRIVPRGSNATEFPYRLATRSDQL